MQEIRLLFWFLVRIIGGGFCLVTKTSENGLFVGSINHGISFANTKKKKDGKRGGKTQLRKFRMKSGVCQNDLDGFERPIIGETLAPYVQILSTTPKWTKLIANPNSSLQDVSVKGEQLV